METMRVVGAAYISTDFFGVEALQWVIHIFH